MAHYEIQRNVFLHGFIQTEIGKKKISGMIEIISRTNSRINPASREDVTTATTKIMMIMIIKFLISIFFF